MDRFDYTDGDFCMDMGGGMMMDTQGHMMQDMGGGMAMDMESGEMHIVDNSSSFGIYCLIQQKNHIELKDNRYTQENVFSLYS